MCGYVGFTTAKELPQSVIETMMDRIRHRGPDMGGVHQSEGIALGFRRLSIQDLREEGAQPMYNEDSSLVVVFNGEIYNFQTLREELQGKGHVFRSLTDTEVLLHGYEEWGQDLLLRLRGMFSFVIYDTKTHSLFGARDYFGIKPLYYSQLKTGELLFGSEIKSFLDHPDFELAFNPDALRPYLTFQYSALPETFFKRVFKLPLGHAFTFSEGKMNTWAYWTPEFNEKDRPLTEASRELNKIVTDSVAAHKISDVPVGAFLSGGVDSSYIAAALRPEHGFTVGFSQERFNEVNEAKALSDILGIDHVSRILDPDECFAALSDIQYHLDEPDSNPSVVPLYFLAKLAREHVTVVLSGEGADELFGGYDWYVGTQAMNRFRKLPLSLRRGLGSLAKGLPRMKGRNFLIKCADRPRDHFVGQAMVFEDKEALAVLKPHCQKGPSAKAVCAPYYDKVQDKSPMTQMQYLDIHVWMPGDILLKADKMCMAHSLELRVPYLDKVVMDFAQTVPENLRLVNGTGKMVLRRASEQILPDEWVKRPKKGFPVPVRLWLREEKYYLFAKEYMESAYAAEFFEQGELLRMLDAHYQGTADYGRKLWTVLTFLIWYRRFFIEEAAKRAKV